MANTRNQNRMSANDIIKLGGSAIAASIVLFFGWKTYKKISDKVADNKEGSAFKKELNYSNVRKSDLELKNIADTIEIALNQTDDDETAVYNALSRLETKDDWLKLNVIFGRRKRNANWPYSDIEGGLIEWLYDAFNSYEISKVNKILAKINVKM